MQIHKGMMISDILAGKVHVLSFNDIAFCPDEDIAAGVLCALNFARLAFATEQSTGAVLSETLTSLLSKKAVENALSICREWPHGVHVEVEDLFHIPPFEATLKLVSTDYDSPSTDHITRLLENMRTLSSSAVILVTRYPHVIACLRLPTSSQEAFVLFNPRGTSEHERVASLTASSSLSHIVQRLCDIFPTDKIHLAQGNLDSQARLLSKCARHLFVSGATAYDSRIGEEHLIVASLTLLTLKAELDELTRDNGILKNEKHRLEKNVVDLGARLEEEKANATRALSFKSSDVKPTRYTPPGRTRQLTQSSYPTRQRKDLFDRQDELDPNMEFALQLQATFDSENDLKQKHARLEERAKTTRAQSFKPSEVETTRGVGWGPQLTQSSHFFGERKDPFEREHELDPDMEFVLQLQATFDSENNFLLKQKHELMQTAQRQYHCGVCLDDFPEDDAIHIDACGHEICRDCAHGHVRTKIEEHRFPVLCPVCMADHKSQHPGTIPGALVQLLGVSEKQWETWVEMELAQFSIPFTCRKCHHSAFVDKQDLEASPEIHCPFPACDHVWCKKCQQTIDPSGPKHSCDGTSELDHLMKQQGWRYCPSCKTPIQKTYGCNHLSCISPGCNTHFCYGCGGTINRTAIPREIQEGKMAHFRTCPIV